MIIDQLSVTKLKKIVQTEIVRLNLNEKLREKIGLNK